MYELEARNFLLDVSVNLCSKSKLFSRLNLSTATERTVSGWTLSTHWLEYQCLDVRCKLADVKCATKMEFRRTQFSQWETKSNLFKILSSLSFFDRLFVRQNVARCVRRLRKETLETRFATTNSTNFIFFLRFCYSSRNIFSRFHGKIEEFSEMFNKTIENVNHWKCFVDVDRHQFRKTSLNLERENDFWIEIEQRTTKIEFTRNLTVSFGQNWWFLKHWTRK